MKSMLWERFDENIYWLIIAGDESNLQSFNRNLFLNELKIKLDMLRSSMEGGISSRIGDIDIVIPQGQGSVNENS